MGREGEVEEGAEGKEEEVVVGEGLTLILALIRRSGRRSGRRRRGKRERDTERMHECLEGGAGAVWGWGGGCFRIVLLCFIRTDARCPFSFSSTSSIAVLISYAHPGDHTPTCMHTRLLSLSL